MDFPLWVRLALVNPFAKFKERSFIHSRDIEGGFTFLKGSRDQVHAPFRGNFSTPAVRLAAVDPFAKFKQCSFINSRNIEGGLTIFQRAAS